MKSKLYILFTILAIWSGIEMAQAVPAGFAFGMNNKILETSREYILEHLQSTLDGGIDLPDFTVPFAGDNHFYNNQLSLDRFQAPDVATYFHAGKLYVQIDNLGGEIRGSSWKKTVFGNTERFDYRASGMRGTFGLSYQVTPSWEYVDEHKIPVPVVSGVNFKVPRKDLVDIAIVTKDVGPLLLDASIQTFKPIFLNILLPELNGGFLNTVLNTAIISEVAETRGQMPRGLLEILLYMIPNDRVVIPPEIQMRYNLANGQPVAIDMYAGVLYGYYEGKIEGMGNQAITNSTYHTPGDLAIQLSGEPFQFQISTSLINDMFEVLLGNNVVQTDIPYSKFSEYNFPLDFTSTVLDSAVPGLVDVIGYDVSLSARFFNRGAPRFIFTKDEMFVTYNLALEVFNEDFSKKLFRVYYDDVEVTFDMELYKSFELNVEWETVTMGKVRMEDSEELFSIRDQERADQHMQDFFDWTLDFVLPWIQVKKPKGLCKFDIPVTIPGLLKFNSIELEVRKNYLDFGIDLWFSTYFKEEWRTVQSSR